MELLLNLAWLLLAVPAYWLWRGSRNTRAGRQLGSFHCVVALGCLLFMLFPVISATDDLVAMRTEMEESPAGKRSIRQAATDKSSAWKTRLQSPPALLGTSLFFTLTVQCGALAASSWSPLPDRRKDRPIGRAPPTLQLA